MGVIRGRRVCVGRMCKRWDGKTGMSCFLREEMVLSKFNCSGRGKISVLGRRNRVCKLVIK